jgi:4-hydroxyproline epimerase
VIIDGFPELGRGPMAERLEVFRRGYDKLRAAIVCEPRGHAAIVGALLCKPVDPESAAGVIFSTMSAISACAVTEPSVS